MTLGAVWVTVEGWPPPHLRARGSWRRAMFVVRASASSAPRMVVMFSSKRRRLGSLTSLSCLRYLRSVFTDLHVLRSDCRFAVATVRSNFLLFFFERFFLGTERVSSLRFLNALAACFFGDGALDAPMAEPIGSASSAAGTRTARMARRITETTLTDSVRRMQPHVTSGVLSDWLRRRRGNADDPDLGDDARRPSAGPVLERAPPAGEGLAVVRRAGVGGADHRSRRPDV